VPIGAPSRARTCPFVIPSATPDIPFWGTIVADASAAAATSTAATVTTAARRRMPTESAAERARSIP
jgi:hypothetical protein